MTVQINYVNGEVGVYECTQRPYFTYENNTAMLHLTHGTTMVVNMAQVLFVSYPDIRKKTISEKEWDGDLE